MHFARAMNVNEGGANVTEAKANLDGRCGPHRARRRSPFSSSFVAALAIATASFLVLASLALVFVPPVGLSLERTSSGDWVVSDVPVAESAWLAGVRPGMTVDGVTPGADPTHWDSLLLSDGTMFVTIERNPRPPGVLVLVPGVLALLVAIAAYRLAPGMASWLLVIPALTSLAFASDFVPAPIAFGLIVAPPAIGVLHIVERRRDLPRFATGVAATAVALVGVGWILAYVLRFELWDVPRQFSAAIALELLALASAGAVRQARWRARTRLARNGSTATSPTALLAATVDELIPGRNRSRLLAIESERTHLASDLHADVLPELAAVIRAADAGMNPTETASRLRAIADELRDLMAERRLAVLDELGLVPALEWLAERIEERTKIRVEINIRGDDVQRAPREVELAAYRIAQQAIDNALVHAHADTIRIDLTISGNRLELDVTDDGLGLPVDAEARALRAGHLGLADMRARAVAIGGTFRIGSRPDSGTTAALRWPV